jgi:hypothetical protein
MLQAYFHKMQCWVSSLPEGFGLFLLISGQPVAADFIRLPSKTFL